MFKILFAFLTSLLILSCDSDSVSYEDSARNSVKISELQLYDANNTAISNLTLGGGVLKAFVVNSSNQPIEGAIVSFISNSEGLELSQSTSGQVQTDVNGIAQIFIKPASFDVTGSFTIKVKAIQGSDTVTKDITFSVQPTNIVLSDITLEETTIASGGQTNFSLSINDSEGNPVQNIPVKFSTNCGQVTESQATNASGEVTGTYRGIAVNKENDDEKTLCKDSATITATVASNTPKTVTVLIHPPAATSIVYNNSEPVNLGILGSGSSSSSEISFTVFSNQTPLPNVEVKLSLKRSPEGFSFGDLSNTDDIIRKSDDSGVVRVSLYPGNTPGPVEIEASLVGDSSKTALSKNISVAQSRVTQSGFSVAIENNVLSWDADGTTTSLKVRISDRNGNPAPDGTVISFTAEAGQIQPNCASQNGFCSVTFTTQRPRTADGRVSILTVVEGEKTYLDKNNNNAWDVGIDTITNNIGHAYRDDNENSQHDDGEFIYRTRSENTSSAQCAASGQFVYPNISGTCNNGLDAILRKQIITLISNDDAKITVLKQTDGEALLKVNSPMYPLHPMPSGTKVSGTTQDNTPNNDIECTATKTQGKEILSAISSTKPGVDLGTTHGYIFANCVGSDQFIFTVTSPNQTETQYVHSFN